MTAPDMIYAMEDADVPEIGRWANYPFAGAGPYLRRDPAVLAADPMVQALIGEVVEEAVKVVWAEWLRDAEDVNTFPTDVSIAIRAIRPAATAALQRALREAGNEGLERAAKFVDKRAQTYHDEHGIYDYSTDVTEYPGTGSESMEEWEEIAEAIRALKEQPE
jgi:hypothetical protein